MANSPSGLEKFNETSALLWEKGAAQDERFRPSR